MTKNPDIPKNLKDISLCCDELKRVLLQGQAALAYNDEIRELQIFNKCYQWIIPIGYCPFCGSQQPDSLANRWEEELANLLGPDYSDEDIPSEFLSSLWWRSRGIP